MKDKLMTPQTKLTLLVETESLLNDTTQSVDEILKLIKLARHFHSSMKPEKIPFNIDNKKELCDDNLITLCEHCHCLFGHLCNWKSYNEHVREDARTWQKKIENRP